MDIRECLNKEQLDLVRQWILCRSCGDPNGDDYSRAIQEFTDELLADLINEV